MFLSIAESIVHALLASRLCFGQEYICLFSCLLNLLLDVICWLQYQETAKTMVLNEKPHVLVVKTGLHCTRATQTQSSARSCLCNQNLHKFCILHCETSVHRWVEGYFVFCITAAIQALTCGWYGGGWPITPTANNRVNNYITSIFIITCSRNSYKHLVCNWSWLLMERMS